MYMFLLIYYRCARRILMVKAFMRKAVARSAKTTRVKIVSSRPSQIIDGMMREKQEEQDNEEEI